jgi:hypothetical protein
MFYRLASNLEYKISTITAITHNQSYNTKGSDDINGYLISKWNPDRAVMLYFNNNNIL